MVDRVFDFNVEITLYQGSKARKVQQYNTIICSSKAKSNTYTSLRAFIVLKRIKLCYVFLLYIFNLPFDRSEIICYFKHILSRNRYIIFLSLLDRPIITGRYEYCTILPASSSRISHSSIPIQTNSHFSF